MAVSFDLFGTLLTAERPSDPAAAVGRELAARGVSLPGDWPRAYREDHRAVPPGTEAPLADHVSAALASRGVDAPTPVVAEAVRAAFTDGEVYVRQGARDAVRAADAVGPVGICSNCSVPGLVERTLDASALDRSAFDAVVSSVDCGWRKPDRRAFAAVADRLGVPVADLVHVGDDPATDGGVNDAGGEFVRVGDGQLENFPAVLEGRAWD